jgi:hypothetical protein
MDTLADQVIDKVGKDLLLKPTLFVQGSDEVREDSTEFTVAHRSLLLYPSFPKLSTTRFLKREGGADQPPVVIPSGNLPS